MRKKRSSQFTDWEMAGTEATVWLCYTDLTGFIQEIKVMSVSQIAQRHAFQRSTKAGDGLAVKRGEGLLHTSIDIF
jgi:hypothetical protein